MKYRNALMIISIATTTLLLSASLALGQWETDVRLTFDSANSYTAFNNAWCIAAEEDTVHIVWADERDGNYEIYYKRSVDGGTSWGTSTRMTFDSDLSLTPTVAVDGSNVHLAWTDSRDGNEEIYYKRSIDNGNTWSSSTRLTINSDYSRFPSMAVQGSFVHIVWYDDRPGNWEIYYKRSIDGGSSFETDARLTNDASISTYPSIAFIGSYVHVAWQDYRHGWYEIYYKRSVNDGVSWESDTRLTTNSSESSHPSIGGVGDNAHVAWLDDRDANQEIYYKNSTNAGVSWGSDTRITTASNYSFNPSIACMGSNVHLSWHDGRDGNPEIYYNRSTDDGTTWETDTRLTNESATSGRASIAVAGEAVHVVWYDWRVGNAEIYYKRNATGNPGVEEENGVSPRDKLISISPNPSKGNIIIKYGISEKCNVSIKIYDISGKLVSTIFEGDMLPGNHTTTWDCKSNDNTFLPAGVYFCTMKSKDTKETAKIMITR